MANLWIEGFETCQTATYLAGKYAAQSGTIGTATGRLFGTAITMSGTGANLTTPSFGVQNTHIVGFGYNLTAVGGTPQVIIMSGASEQCSLHVVGSGGGYVWVLKRGSTTIATSAVVRDLSTWTYVELKVTTRTGTNGVYELRVDTVLDFSGASVNLADTGSDGADVIQFSATTNVSQWDDIYINDDQGAVNNDFLGDQAVRGILPTADGASSQWTTSTGSNHAALVDDSASASNDADYVKSNTPGNLDLYDYANLTGLINGPITAIMVDTRMKQETTGVGTVKVVIRQGGVNRDQATHTVNGTPVVSYTQIIENSPDDSAPWEVADIDALQCGVEKVT